MVARKGLNMKLYLHCLPCFISLRRADRSSREALPNVVCLSEIVKQRQWWGPGQLVALASRKIKRLKQSVFITGTQCLYSRSQLDSTINYMGRGSSAGIATRYELDVPGIESSWRNPSRQALQPIQPPTKWLQVIFSWVKLQGRGVDHPHHPMPTLKKEYCYTSSPPLGP
jgi:hypothetical protein